MKKVTILIPTKNRITALVATVTSLLFQTYQHFDIVISDQSSLYNIADFPTLKTLQRIFKEKSVRLSFFKHLPEQGMAEQREFLLHKSTTQYTLFLDDDCILENFVVRNLVTTIEKEQCGFVGQAVIGMSFLSDIRPHEQHIEFWQSKVQPEIISPNSKKWKRHILHNAANIYHIQQKYHATADNPKSYKIAWVGGCILYNTKKLKSVGGFSFWKNLPPIHVGEDVFTQLQMMEKYGGCAIIPSGVYHQELPTTLPYREVNTPEFLKPN